MDFCQNCYDNGGEVKPGEAGCWCETLGYYINAWFGNCPEEQKTYSAERALFTPLRSKIFLRLKYRTK
jgi:hypothetical protein